jgi:hypothetical protein
MEPAYHLGSGKRLNHRCTVDTSSVELGHVGVRRGDNLNRSRRTVDQLCEADSIVTGLSPGRPRPVYARPRPFPGHYLEY